MSVIVLLIMGSTYHVLPLLNRVSFRALVLAELSEMECLAWLAVSVEMLVLEEPVVAATIIAEARKALSYVSFNAEYLI